MRHLSTALSGLAFLWTSAATVYLLLASRYQGVVTSSRPGGRVEMVGNLGVSLVSANGVWLVGLLLLVTLTAGLPLGVALTDPARHRMVARSAGVLLLGFSLIAGFSIGLAYLPGAVVLLASASAVQVRSRPGIPTDEPRDPA